MKKEVLKNVKEELKRINSTVITIFNDFMNSIKFDEVDYYEKQDEDEYDIDYFFFEKRIRLFILDLITEENPIRMVKSRIMKNGEYFTFGNSKQTLLIIDWIKNNLDVWEIIELDYDETKQNRIFEFKRKDIK